MRIFLVFFLLCGVAFAQETKQDLEAAKAVLESELIADPDAQALTRLKQKADVIKAKQDAIRAIEESKVLAEQAAGK